MAVRDDFSAGEVLAAADLNDTFASKVDYALPTNAQTGTTYTFVAADAEKLTTASNASPVTLTIPPQSSVTWSDSTVLRVVNYGAGAVTIDGGSGVTVTNTSSTIAQYGAAVAIRTGSDAWTVVPFGGGDETIQAAEISSPSATGQYTDSGTTYDYYTFTASGTLTVDTAGFADVLVIGGGGGGGGASGGGGGAGGHLYVTDAYLSAGTATVTVGAGGVGGVPDSNEGQYGNNGITSRISSYFSTGGGGGAAFARTSTGSSQAKPGLNGGSGGGAARGNAGSNNAGGAGVTDLGNDGGDANVGLSSASGGGGGASAAGNSGTGTAGGAGGAGTANSITGSSVTRAGGGGGSGTGSAGAGGSGGGGAGAVSGTATSGTSNTGGGGGGAATGGNGGSGVVIVRVKV